MKKKVTLGLIGLLLTVTSPFSNAQSAEETVSKHCRACHESGLGGAPKLDDKAAWAPRLEKGTDTMLATVTSGKGAMPPKGTCMNCSESDLRAAIELMTAEVK